jgi:hypothetical protein
VINTAKTIIAPGFQRVDLLQIGETFKNANNADTAMQMSVASCRYRLPNVGLYECYYAYQRYGNLILRDPETNVCKLLNIYADDLGGDNSTTVRYFYMDKNEISIYEGTCYDDGCSLHEKYRIVIHEDGRINIISLMK